MSKVTCSNPDCTVAVTRKCVRSIEPFDKCENIRLVAGQDGVEQHPPLASDETATVFHGNELGWQQTSAILGERYGTLIGLLGATGTGKTCLLSSMYLLASCGELKPNYLFAGSQTLSGFESRIRRLRGWKGPGLPEQITDHTILADERQPGVMHLSLRRPRDSALKDLLITDIPGEWTTDAVRRADKVVRLKFLRRADAIVIAMDATTLNDEGKKNTQYQFARNLLQRMTSSLQLEKSVPIVFAITRCDKSGKEVPDVIYRIVEAAESFGFWNVSFQLLAAFSENERVPSGMGVAELVATLIERPVAEFSNESPPALSNRSFAQFVHANAYT